MARQRNPVIIRPSQRRQRSKWQREQGKQRAVIIAGIIAVFFILAIPAYGYWSNFIAPPRNIVLQVDDTKYSLGFMSKYLKGIQEFGGQVDLSMEPFRLLQALEENELIRSGAEARGATLDPSEIDDEVRNRIIGSAPELAEVPPDQLEREFEEKYRQYLNTVNLSEGEHRRLVEATLLRKKLSDIMGENIPKVAEQANVSWIVVAPTEAQDENQSLLTSERIQLVVNRLEQGDDFATLAKEYSDHRSTAVNGGEYGWVPRGTLGDLDDIIFSLEPGEISEAVYAGESTYFVKVTEVDEAKNIDKETRERLKRAALQQWLTDERGNHRIKMCFGGGTAGGSCDWQYDWLVKQLREASLG